MGAPDHISVTTVHCFEADDQNYHWKEISWEKWHGEPVERKDAFCPGSGRSDDLGASAHLSTLFKYPFLKWGNGLSLDAIQIEAEKPAYTFRQHEPMPVALKASFMFPHKPVRFVDNEDETVCWALYGYPDGGDVFQVHSRADELSDGMDDHEAELAVLRDQPATRVITLDREHPYRRTVDLAKLYRFPGPGKYLVQPRKDLCQFFKEDAGFAGQVIEVTITP